ncbi:MAG: FHA domain-containing protein [Thermodesulfobacteriota bacterium]
MAKPSGRDILLKQWSFSLRGVKGPYEGRSFPINKFPCRIGRRQDCDIKLVEDKAVSAFHCRLDCLNGEVWIEDLVSRNGTFCDGRRIDSPVAVTGDATRLKIGRTHFQLVRQPNKAELEPEEVSTGGVESGTIILSQFQDKHLPQRETLFVTDISDSTGFISNYGEKAYLRFFDAIVMLVTRYGRRDNALFVKCTGDGFLGTFRNTSEALSCAASVMHHFLRLIKKYPEYSFTGLRMALHRGEVAVLEDGDRIGQAVHQVCRMEGAQAADRTNPRPVDLPPTNRILISREVLGDIGVESKKSIVDVGDFTLKGFPDPVRLFWITDIQPFLKKKSPG